MTSGDKWLDEVQRRQFERLIVHEEAHSVTLREQIAKIQMQIDRRQAEVDRMKEDLKALSEPLSSTGA